MEQHGTMTQLSLDVNHKQKSFFYDLSAHTKEVIEKVIMRLDILT